VYDASCITPFQIGDLARSVKTRFVIARRAFLCIQGDACPCRLKKKSPIFLFVAPFPAIVNAEGDARHSHLCMSDPGLTEATVALLACGNRVFAKPFPVSEDGKEKYHPGLTGIE